MKEVQIKYGISFKLHFSQIHVFHPSEPILENGRLKMFYVFTVPTETNPNLSHFQVVRDHPERFHKAPVYLKIFSFLSIPCVITRQWQRLQTDVHNYQSHNSWCIYTNVQILPQEWISGEIHYFLLKSCLGNLAGIPGENIHLFQNIFLANRSKSLFQTFFPLDQYLSGKTAWCVS